MTTETQYRRKLNITGMSSKINYTRWKTAQIRLCRRKSIMSYITSRCRTYIPPAHGQLWTGLANNPACGGLVAGIGDSFTNMLVNSPKQFESLLHAIMGRYRHHPDTGITPRCGRGREGDQADTAAGKGLPQENPVFDSLHADEFRHQAAGAATHPERVSEAYTRSVVLTSA
jgi:hypothetical protein